MKTVKRTLAILLLLTMMFCVVSAPGTAAAASKPEKVTGLQITTDGKAKTLKLTWDATPGVRGYQVFRKTAGEKWQKVAVTAKTLYLDSGLKSSVGYYYKVRAYVKQNGAYLFGDFAKANLSTQITKSFAQKRLQAAYKVANYWLSPAQPNCDLSVSIPAGKGTNFDCYHPVKDGKIKTKAQLVSYLCKYFAWQFAQEVVDAAYIEKDGKLYMGETGYGDAAAHNYQNDRVDYIWQKDGYATVFVIEEHEDYEGKFEIPYPHGLYYENGRWVFGEEDGIRSYGRLNYWNFWEFR